MERVSVSKAELKAVFISLAVFPMRTPGFMHPLPLSLIRGIRVKRGAYTRRAGSPWETQA